MGREPARGAEQGDAPAPQGASTGAATANVRVEILGEDPLEDGNGAACTAGGGVGDGAGAYALLRCVMFFMPVFQCTHDE